jgi:GT2 family glycosyltransferase
MPSSNDLVSIIIPVHSKDKAEKCVSCIKRQTYRKIELILADFEGFPAEKRNYGYGKSKGSLILFLDEDEYMSPTTISACVDKFRDGFEIVGIPQIKVEPKRYFEKCASILRENIAKPLFFKREVLEKVGTFRTEYVLCDDLDLLIRAFAAGYELGIIDMNDGCILHDENSLTGMLRKTFLVRKSYKKLQKKNRTKLDALTRKHSQRKRILKVLLTKPILLPGTLLIIFILFFVRRLP